MRWVRSMEMWYSQDPYHKLGNLQMGKLLQFQRFSPRSKGSKPQEGLPNLWVLHQEDEPLECLTLKASRVYFQESQRIVANRDSTLNRCTSSRTQGRSNNLKGAWLSLTCWSLLFSRWVVSDSLWPHGLQHTRPHCLIFKSFQKAGGNWDSAGRYKHEQQPFWKAHPIRRTQKREPETWKTEW